MVKVRLPCQAGAFYKGTAESLRKQIKSCFLHELGPGKLPAVAKNGLKHVVGLVCPHAGYVYSGPVAAHAYYELALDGKPDVAVILGPNHRGYGSPLATMSEGVWRTPLGDVEIDADTAAKIMRESKIVDIDESAHRFEHSVEVQLPFLQYIYGPEFKIVPVCFLMQDLDSVREVGKAIGRVLNGKNAVIIASSDMTHYESQEKASENDVKAIGTIESMNEDAFYSILEKRRITACGYGPIGSLITAARAMGAKEAKLLCYKTSGDVSGDYSSVVGYASMCFTK